MYISPSCLPPSLSIQGSSCRTFVRRSTTTLIALHPVLPSGLTMKSRLWSFYGCSSISNCRNNLEVFLAFAVLCWHVWQFHMYQSTPIEILFQEWLRLSRFYVFCSSWILHDWGFMAFQDPLELVLVLSLKLDCRSVQQLFFVLT
jgi:hypothetical protein